MEKLLWSIALPGFGQFLNGQFSKGTLLVFLEALINVRSHFNETIFFSFHGQIETAIQHTNFQWLMFYPCVYLFAVWDAYRNDNATDPHPYTFFPFVFGAYSVTTGLILSPSLKIMGFLLGPVWLPMSFLLPGVAMGWVVKYIFMKWKTYHR